MTRQDAYELMTHKSSVGAVNRYKANVDIMFDYFEKELVKVRKEYYIKGSDACHESIRGSNGNKLLYAIQK